MTLLGKHTLDETRDLLASADYRFKETGKAYDALQVKPTDLAADWGVLSAKWAKDRKVIANDLTEKALRGFPMPSSTIITEDTWKKILDYVQFQENVRGSLQDITHRIEVLSGQPILYPNQPKPKDTTDVDVELFKKLDNTTRNLDAAADAAKQGAKDAASSNWAFIVGGTIVVTIVGSQVLKKYL